MFLINFFHFLSGYVRIRVEGYFLERFLNLSLNKSINVWHIEKASEGVLYANVSIRSFKKLKKIAQKTGVRVHIVEKKGLPFYTVKYDKRYGIAVGVLAFFIIIAVMSLFVWDIDVIPSEHLNEAEIRTQLENNGFHIGVFTPWVDTERICSQIVIDNDELVWCGISIDGSRATVEVKERRERIPILDEGTPCDVVASRTGVVDSVLAYNGQSVCQPGDAVEAGDLLISGVHESEVTGTTYLHARGKVMATTYREIDVEQPLYQQTRTKTGEHKSHYTLRFLNFRLNLYRNDSIPYQEYDKIEEENLLQIGSFLVLPIGVESVRYEQVQVDQVPLSEEEAYELASQTLSQKELEIFGTDISVLSAKVEYSVEGDVLKMKGIYTCSEDIAFEREIVEMQPGMPQEQAADPQE